MALTKHPRPTGMTELEQAVHDRDEAQQTIREAQFKMREAEQKAVDQLIRAGMHDCFSVNWQRVRRVLRNN